jgi:hypothetical protein
MFPISFIFFPFFHISIDWRFRSSYPRETEESLVGIGDELP